VTEAGRQGVGEYEVACVIRCVIAGANSNTTVC